jgi:hypothetical protein
MSAMVLEVTRRFVRGIHPERFGPHAISQRLPKDVSPSQELIQKQQFDDIKPALLIRAVAAMLLQS